MTTVEERVGTVLDGRYRLEEVVGRGGFGVVYRATHLGLDTTVAVKFLLAEWAGSAETRKRFEREAAALVKLRHPGIVTALDFARSREDLYLVMEWVQGQDLSKLLLVDGQTLPPLRIVAILDQVLDVLESAHAAGVIHRDLKPENIMLVRDPQGRDRAMVLDFGLALFNDGADDKRLTASDAVHGTCYYMSPEQCRSRDVGPATDVYAMGVILFELLAGEPPFLGETSVDVMVQQLVVEPPPVKNRGVRREPPPALEAIARACLSKKAESRPTASELRAQLRAFAEGKDATTLALEASHERVAAATRSRDERAIGAAVTQDEGVNVRHATVFVWGFGPKVEARIRAALALVGVRTSGWTADAPPTDEPVDAVVIAGDEQASRRLERLRATPALARTPALVAEVPSADRTPALIRSGASDVSLASVGEDVLVQKLVRLLRRKR